jgi:hypothetical protein
MIKTQQQKNPFILAKMTLFINEKLVPKREISQSILGCVGCSKNGNYLGESKIFSPSLMLSM